MSPVGYSHSPLKALFTADLTVDDMLEGDINVCTSRLIVYTCILSNILRFNKIAIQGTPQMAVDKELIESPFTSSTPSRSLKH